MTPTVSFVWRFSTLMDSTAAARTFLLLCLRIFILNSTDGYSEARLTSGLSCFSWHLLKDGHRQENREPCSDVHERPSADLSCFHGVCSLSQPCQAWRTLY